MPLTAWGAAASNGRNKVVKTSVNVACCKTSGKHYFCFSPFSIEVKILFRFLSISENG